MESISFIEPFEAHWGAPGGFVQTIVGSQLRDKSLPSPPRILHELHLNDEGRAVIHEIKPKNETLYFSIMLSYVETPLVLLLLIVMPTKCLAFLSKRESEFSNDLRHASNFSGRLYVGINTSSNVMHLPRSRLRLICLSYSL